MTKTSLTGSIWEPTSTGELAGLLHGISRRAEVYVSVGGGIRSIESIESDDYLGGAYVVYLSPPDKSASCGEKTVADMAKILHFARRDAEILVLVDDDAEEIGDVSIDDDGNVVLSPMCDAP